MKHFFRNRIKPVPIFLVLAKSQKVKYNRKKSGSPKERLDSMKNVADIIESFIVGQLLADSQNTLLVQRNELADRLDCAPSQISYVLSTRFTPARGYLVESRRGSGGFIRIVRIVPRDNHQKASPTVEELLNYWLRNRMLTQREHAILKYFLSILDLPEAEKQKVLQKAISKMVATE